MSGSDRPPFTFFSVKPAELTKEMECLNANKASGYDGLPPRLIYEKLLSKQIVNFVDPTLSDNLTTYRKTHSFKTTLIQLVEGWKMELDSGKLVGMLLTDMRKAFDSLYSPLLIKKLESYRF